MTWPERSLPDSAVHPERRRCIEALKEHMSCLDTVAYDAVGDRELPDGRLTEVHRGFNRELLALLGSLLSDDALMHLAGCAEEIVQRRRARRPAA